tara:strand:+ start:238 stop:384 length:147 start_codon:yes stop_codon:yes gene_type:complete
LIKPAWVEVGLVKMPPNPVTISAATFSSSCLGNVLSLKRQLLTISGLK